MIKQLIRILLIGSIFLTYGCFDLGGKTKPVSDDDLMNLAQESAADTKVSALPELAATPAGSDTLYIIDDNVSKKITVDNLHGGYEPLLVNEAGLYSALSDVSNFLQESDLSANGFSLVTAADYAAMKVLLDLEIGTDILAEQTIGISDDNLLEVDGSPNSAEYARFTANGLEGRIESEFKADFNLEDSDINTLIDAKIDDTAYNATSWNNNTEAATKNAIRDKFESIGAGSGDVVGPGSAGDNNIAVFDSTTGKLIKDSGATLDSNGLSLAAVAAPLVSLNDSDSPGTDKWIGSFEGQYIDGADGSENADLFWYGQQGGSKTLLWAFDESDDQLEFSKNTTLQTGDIIRAELEADIIDETKLDDNSIDSEHYNDGSIDNEHLADNAVDTQELAADAVEGTKIADDQVDSEHYVASSIDNEHMADNSVTYLETTGSSKSLTPVTGSTTGFAAGFTGANLYGGTYIVNSDDGDLQLPLMVAGMNFTIITLGAIEVVADTNANDGYLMDGTTNVEGKNLTNLSTAGDIAVFQYYTADDWLITTNDWTPEA